MRIDSKSGRFAGTVAVASTLTASVAVGFGLGIVPAFAAETCSGEARSDTESALSSFADLCGMEGDWRATTGYNCDWSDEGWICTAPLGHQPESGEGGSTGSDQSDGDDDQSEDNDSSSNSDGGSEESDAPDEIELVTYDPMEQELTRAGDALDGYQIPTSDSGGYEFPELEFDE